MRVSLAIVVAFLFCAASLCKAEYLTVDTTTGALHELNIFSLPDLIARAQEQQQHNSPEVVWPTASYNTDDVQCSDIVSAQRIAITNTYEISQWYYSTYHDLVAISIDITDLAAATAAAARIDAWRGNPTCDQLWTRLYVGLVAPLIESNAFRKTMTISDPNVGIQVSMLCGEQTCSVGAFTSILQITLPEHAR